MNQDLNAGQKEKIQVSQTVLKQTHLIACPFYPVTPVKHRS